MPDDLPILGFGTCSRCGGQVPVYDEDVMEILKTQAVEMFHDRCGDKGPENRRFRVRVILYELFSDPDPDESDEPGERAEELLAVAGEAEGLTFVEAFPDLEKKLGVQWQKVREHGSIVDALGSVDPSESLESAGGRNLQLGEPVIVVQQGHFGGPGPRQLIVPS